MQHDMYTNQELMIDVGDGHTLYVLDWGNKDAKVPFIFLHGGPGSSVKDKHKASFDPARQRVIFFDQRGCGRSTPLGSVENNTTEKLIADISTIAVSLQIPKFIVHGTSWGSTLALAYAIKHPERVSALVIGGVFTASQVETDWLSRQTGRTPSR